MERTWEMNWLDVVRMADDPAMRIPPNKVDIIKMLPTVRTYKRKNGTVAQIRRGIYYSFIASKKEFHVRRWLVKEIGELPPVMEQFKAGGDRWNLIFKKE